MSGLEPRGSNGRIRALKFSAAAMGEPAEQSTLDINELLNFEGIQEEELPLVWVIDRKDLVQLRPFDEKVEDKGTKHKSKGLAACLLGRPPEKMPLIDGSYLHLKTVDNGIQFLLRKALEAKEARPYLIGIAGNLFRELWDRGSAKEEKIATVSQTEQPAFDKPEEPFSSSLIRELHSRCNIPPGLTLQYEGSSEEAALVRALIFSAAGRKMTVLILGDTGTGKEMVAREIHRLRNKGTGDLISVNCGGIPPELLESELFGHKRGAFTGAVSDKTGLWETANKGTLFLDEIGDLLPQHQAKILRTLQEGKIRPVGSTREVQVDARVIAATNCDLLSMVHAGRFREDLYYRLCGFVIRTPALRDHPTDIPLLARLLWKRINGEGVQPLPDEILNELATYAWPGNVRELKMVLNRLSTLFGTKDLGTRHLHWVFQLEGHRSFDEKGVPARETISSHRLSCFRHLKRAYETIDACQYITGQFMTRQDPDPDAPRHPIEDLSLTYERLAMLCRKPLLFHSERTFSDVHRLQGAISYLISIIEKAPKEAKDYWKAEVSPAFARTLSSIFKEIETILREEQEGFAKGRSFREDGLPVPGPRLS
jgi:DNA-binding NtrC family response regulator